MSESKLFDFMNVDLPEPKRSNVPWRFVNRFSASPGYINVSAVIEVLPTDRWTGNLHSILRSRPTISSIYGSFRESHQAFFVPARLYSAVLDQLQTYGGVEFDPNADVRLPQFGWHTRGDEIITALDGINLPCSLMSQLRMFPQMFNATGFTLGIQNAIVEGEGREYPQSTMFNAIPYVGYYDILRNYYYNDQELEMPFVTGEFFSDTVDYVNISRSQLDSFVKNVYDESISPDVFVSSPPGLRMFSEVTGRDSVYYPDFSTFVSSTEDVASTDICANHLGLGVRTYDDDYFTVSLNNDYVDELNNTARVVVSNGSFSVTQMQRANRLHKHASRNVLRGSDYEDYLYVHFNAKLGREFNKPIFLGSVSNDFYFEDIYSTQVTSINPGSISNSTLGTRAGVLNSRFSSNDGFIDFTANEYGYIMVLSSIIPRVSYKSNTPRMYFKTGTADFYSPEFDAWSFQDVFSAEFFTDNGGNEESVTGDGLMQYETVVKSQPAWFEHLAPYDYVGGLYATDLEYGFQVLTRDSYYSAEFGGYTGLSSYIRPWEWNYIFQFQKPWFDNFEWQIMFDFNAYRPISKQILPSM